MLLVVSLQSEVRPPLLLWFHSIYHCGHLNWHHSAGPQKCLYLSLHWARVTGVRPRPSMKTKNRESRPIIISTNKSPTKGKRYAGANLAKRTWHHESGILSHLNYIFSFLFLTNLTFFANPFLWKINLSFLNTTSCPNHSFLSLKTHWVLTFLSVIAL